VRSIPQTRHAPIPRQRIETLSDLVFGLALSIGALSLIGNSPTSPADIQGEILRFGFSFIILISVWLRYTHIMSMLPLETMATILVNIGLLFLVSVEPYLLHLVNSFEGSALFDYVSVVYAIDLACLMGILALFSHLIVKENKSLSADLSARERRTRNGFILSASLFAVSTLPPFFLWSFEGTPLRVLFWYAPIVVLWSLRIPMIRRGKQ